MLSLPPVDRSLVVLGCARMPRPEGKLLLYGLQAADITKETFSGSFFPQGNIIIAAVV